MNYGADYKEKFEILDKGTDYDYIRVECFGCGYTHRNSSSWQKCELCPFKKNHVKNYVVKI